MTAEDVMKAEKKETIFLPFKRRKSKLSLGYGKEFKKFLEKRREDERPI
jgi:hypothetical protein